MKKKGLTILVTIAMLLSLMPMAAFAEEGETAVAQIGSGASAQGFNTLQAAVAAAEAGDTVKLLQDVTLRAPIVIAKNLTVDGGGHTITGQAAGGNHRQGLFHLFNEADTAVSFTLKDANLLNISRTGTENTWSNACGISVRASNQTVTLENVTADTSHYCVFVGVPGSEEEAVDDVTVNISNSELTGYAAVFYRTNSKTETIDRPVLNVKNSTLYGRGFNGYGNGFGTIVYNGTRDARTTIEGSTLSNSFDATNANADECVIQFNSWGAYEQGAEVTIRNSTIKTASNTAAPNVINYTCTENLGKGNKVIVDHRTFTSGENEADLLRVMRNGNELVATGVDLHAIFNLEVYVDASWGTPGGVKYEPLLRPGDVALITVDTAVTENTAIPAGVEAQVQAGKTLTVDSNVQLTAQEGGTLTGQQGARLVVKGGAQAAGLTPEVYTWINGAWQTDFVAQVGETKYTTLSAAIAAATGGTAGANAVEVTLLKDVTLDETLVINGGKYVNLNLNGHTISRTDSVMTIQNAHVWITGSGTMQETEPYHSAVSLKGNHTSTADYTYVSIGQDVTLKGWAPLFVTPYEKTGAPYAYGVKADVYGTLVGLNDTDGYTSSVIYINGQIKHKENCPVIHIYPSAQVSSTGSIYGAGYARWNIEGASITGVDAAIAIKAGELNISDGATITCTGPNTAPTEGNSNGVEASGAAIQIESNSGYAGEIEINISGENTKVTSENGYSVYEYIGEGTETKVKSLTVKDGLFKGGFCFSDQLAASEPAKVVVEGGHFTADPSAYLKAENVAVVEGSLYHVVDAGALKAEVAPSQADAKVSDAIGGDAKAEANKVAEALKTEDTKAKVTGIQAAAASVAKETTVTDDEAKSALETGGIITSDAGVKVVVIPVIEIEVTGCEVKSGNVTSLTLDITPMAQTVATKKETAVGNIILAGAGVTDANAVSMDKQPMTISAAVTITIPLPDGFVTEANEKYPNIYINHAKNGTTYTYTATVTKESETLFATFTNPHGFSEFVLTTVNTSVAEVNGVGYATFQDAVNAVANNGTIRVLKGGAYTVSGNKTFTVDNNQETVTLTAASGHNLSKTGDTYTVSRRSTGGSSATYAVTVKDSGHGAVTASSKTAAAGRTVTLTVKADEGYALDTLTVTDAKGKAAALTEKSATVYTFEMPASAVAVEASFKQGAHVCPMDGFHDLDADAWYHSAVDDVLNRGIMSGVSDSSFAPNDTLTRAMAVQILWAVEGKPVVNYAMTFTDVAQNDWYAEAVRWAGSAGVVSGYSADKFGPNDPVTREQMMTILYAYAKGEGKGFADAWMMQLDYVDADQISSWAYEAACWCTTNGVVSGKTGGVLDPKGNATRAEAAKMLVNLMEALEK